MERHYPRVMINSIRVNSRSIVITATSIKFNNKALFNYKASGRKNLPHLKHLIDTNQLEER